MADFRALLSVGFLKWLGVGAVIGALMSAALSAAFSAPDARSIGSAQGSP